MRLAHYARPKSLYPSTHVAEALAASTATSSSWRTIRARWSHTPTWRPAMILDEWAAKEARPISLRQLMVFGRSLSEQRLISSANYVRTELPRRIAHRIRDMQSLPYHVVANPNVNEVYELYYNAFDRLRKIKEIKTLDDNDKFCETISQMLKAHMSVISRLAMGVLECSSLASAAQLDKFMTATLRSRISRRVIAEQHLALTETLHAPWYSPGLAATDNMEFVGKVLSKCYAIDVVEKCAKAVRELARSAYGEEVSLPEVKIEGHKEANFPYILSHLEFIVGELLRNSVQAVIERQLRDGTTGAPAQSVPPIEVTICEAPKYVIIRVSDQGGGVPRDTLPHLWSFCKGSQSQAVLDNLGQIPATSLTPPTPTAKSTKQELHIDAPVTHGKVWQLAGTAGDSSLSSLTHRPPDLKFGMGLPLSRIYAGYWAGKLELHSLEGYGVDAFLQISKLGNKNEQLSIRANMDSV